MKRVVFYEYGTIELGCGCCSEGFSEYSVEENGQWTTLWPMECPLMENEQELRKYLAHLEPFEVDSNSEWFL